MKNLPFTALVCLGLTGCAGSLLTPVSITGADRAQFETSGSVTVAMQETPGFMFTTPGGALVNAGMARWNDPGNAPSWPRITSMHGIPDFTATVREKFQTGLANEVAMVTYAEAEERQPYGTKEETAYVRQYDTDYVLEVRSQYGSFVYGPLSWKTYMLNYSGQARLIRTADEAVVWKHTCQVPAKESEILQVPVEDFLDGDGEKFRAAAEYSTDACAAQLLAAYRGA